jgi:hypothetical protein
VLPVQVERIGPMHQAGSDSLLTAQTFFKVSPSPVRYGFGARRDWAWRLWQLCETAFKGSTNLDETKVRDRS